MSAGGKRVRGVLVLLACEAVGGKCQQAIDAAIAIEMLHNFTLVHDDVMDNAALRRGKPTVHERWDKNVAILSGDEMIALAYQSLLKSPAKRISDVVQTFTNAFVEVCEGQGFDKEFELRTKVRVSDYLMMIKKKTARIISTACETGAIIGGGKQPHVAALRSYGNHLGLAFQMKDDLLDITGDAKEFGKAIGGDIIEGKKTFLLLKALECARGKDKRILQSMLLRKSRTRAAVDRVRQIYDQVGVLEIAHAEIVRRTHAAQRALVSLKPSHAKQMLLWLSDQLLGRSN